MDYLIRSGTLTFPATAAATQTLTVTVPVIRNTTNDVLLETVLLNISSPGATVVRAQATGTIRNR